MLLDSKRNWSLAQRIDDILPRLSDDLREHATPETQSSAIEVATDPHETVDAAIAQVSALRGNLADELAVLGLRAAAAGTHPAAVWHDTVISGGARQQEVYGSMRELARREPTFALHVHIGVGDPEAAIGLYNRLRGHLALLLAISANSPFWQGRDTGLASARIPIFQAFPRVGIPREFDSYDQYVETVDLLLRCDAFPEPTFLWWDIRPQPKLGTIEVRIMDVQTRVRSTRALVSLLQSIAHLELTEGYLTPEAIGTPEMLAENRFIASRDGIDARLIDPVSEDRVPVERLLGRLLDAARPHADQLGCRDSLESVPDVARATGTAEQLRLFHEHGDLAAVVSEMARLFTEPDVSETR